MCVVYKKQLILHISETSIEAWAQHNIYNIYIYIYIYIYILMWCLAKVVA